MLRKMSGPEREELTAGWRKLSNGQRHDLGSTRCYSGNKIVILVIQSRKTRWSGHVAYVGQKRSVCRILMETLEG
jgi:hypothetical protein